MQHSVSIKNSDATTHSVFLSQSDIQISECSLIFDSTIKYVNRIVQIAINKPMSVYIAINAIRFNINRNCTNCN